MALSCQEDIAEYLKVFNIRLKVSMLPISIWTAGIDTQRNFNEIDEDDEGLLNISILISPF